MYSFRPLNDLFFLMRREISEPSVLHLIEIIFKVIKKQCIPFREVIYVKVTHSDLAGSERGVRPGGTSPRSPGTVPSTPHNADIQ